jgi:general stress protein 26
MNLLKDSQQLNIQKFSDRNERILSFLNEHKVGVLSTVDPNNMPNATVIYYSIGPSFTVRFLTKKGTRKSYDIRHNNNVVLVVFDEASQTTVQITGPASEISNEHETHKVFRNTLRASLHTSQSGIPPIAKLHAGDFIAYKIKPQEVRMAVYARPDKDGFERIFELADLPNN